MSETPEFAHAAIIATYKDGLSLRETAHLHGVHMSRVYQLLRRYEPSAIRPQGTRRPELDAKARAVRAGPDFLEALLTIVTEADRMQSDPDHNYRAAAAFLGDIARRAVSNVDDATLLEHLI